MHPSSQSIFITHKETVPTSCHRPNLPSFPAPGIYLSTLSLWICPFRLFRKIEITQYMSFCAWNASVLHYFLWLNVLHCMDIPCFVYPFISRWAWVCYHFLAIMSCCAHSWYTFLCEHMFSVLWNIVLLLYKAKVELLLPGSVGRAPDQQKPNSWGWLRSVTALKSCSSL